MTLLAAKHRIKYYWRRFCIFFYICPECSAWLNPAPSGRKHCPDCGKMK